MRQSHPAGVPYDLDLKPLYQSMAEHYGVGVAPARVRNPAR